MRKKTRIRRRGLSLIELLVILAIIGLLLALLLPAVHRARESARSAQCQSNLRQLGLALSSYHSDHNCLPPGYSPGVVGEDGIWENYHASYSWSAHLLPYIEQAELFNGLDVNGRSLNVALFDRNATSLVQTQLSIYRCPVDLAGLTFENAPIHPALRVLNRTKTGPTGDSIYGASSSYVGNCGYFEAYHPGAATPGTYLVNKSKLTRPNNGVFFSGSHIRFADVTDGASSTLAIGERAWFSGSSMWAGSANIQGAWPGGAGVCLGRVFWRINELPDPPGILITPKNEERIRGAGKARDAFSSYHEGGAHFLLLDGSVRFISEMIDSRNTTQTDVEPTEEMNEPELLGIFQRLGIRNDGQVIGSF